MSERDLIAHSRAEFIIAFNDENIEAMEPFLTDDNISMPPNRPMLAGRDASRQFWQEGFAAARSTLAVMPRELVVAGDLAIDQFGWTMDSTPRAGGTSIHDEGKCIWIWRREADGAWKVARSIWNSDLASSGLWSGAAVAAS